MTVFRVLGTEFAPLVAGAVLLGVLLFCADEGFAGAAAAAAAAAAGAVSLGPALCALM